VLNAEAHDQRNKFISGMDAMVSRYAMSLGNIPLPNGSDNPSVRRNRSGRLRAKLERQHARPVSLIGDGLSDPSDAAVAAALDQSSMELVVSGSPGEEIIFSESRLHPCGSVFKLIRDEPSLPLRERR
jgi:hypothetical protein